ncbi:uncharacterized protein METZ01_LOCUS384535, partial [marine metagenome]
MYNVIYIACHRIRRVLRSVKHLVFFVEERLGVRQIYDYMAILGINISGKSQYYDSFTIIDPKDFIINNDNKKILKILSAAIA